MQIAEQYCSAGGDEPALADAPAHPTLPDASRRTLADAVICEDVTEEPGVKGRVLEFRRNFSRSEGFNGMECSP